MAVQTSPALDAGQSPPRRDFLAAAASSVMAGGLLAGYGMFGVMAGKMLYPAQPLPKGWLFVTDVAGMKVGESRVFVTPIGVKAVIARQGNEGTVEDFAAFSSVCPHLGCQVHWEGLKNRFFCPCHNGTFDEHGQATGGPPLAAHQSLPRYPLMIENGLLFIEAPLESVVSNSAAGTTETFAQAVCEQGREPTKETL